MKTKTPAVSQMTGNFKKAYCRTIEFQNEAGTDTLLEVSPSCSFDGRQWHIHDDEIRLSIHDVGCYDDRTGQWEDNPDVMSSVDGVSWLTFTPHEARQLARELLRFAGSAARLRRSTDPTPNCWKDLPRVSGISGKYGPRRE